MRQARPEDRLALLVQVCQAVQHAHQKGVIHRDIKPSNVLVTTTASPCRRSSTSASPRPWARSDRQDDLHAVRQILGTPLYMSPEQAEMSGVDVEGERRRHIEDLFSGTDEFLG